MKSYRKDLWYVYPERQGVLNITQDVQECLKASSIQEGICLINTMNVTAGVYTNSDEEPMHASFLEWLEGLAPHNPDEKTGSGDTEVSFLDTHLKRTVIGREVMVAVTKGELELGTWEQILYFEFDGKRRKRVLVKIIGE